jgi:hypothetical protein
MHLACECKGNHSKGHARFKCMGRTWPSSTMISIHRGLEVRLTRWAGTDQL